MQKILPVVAAIFMMAVSSLSYSQAQIVDSKPMGGGSIDQPSAVAPAAPTQSALDQSEFYYQLQMLQQEVQQLRGMVDEQAHEIRQLKQQQLDDYVDLDRRVSQLSKASSTTIAPTATTLSQPVTAAPAATPAASAGDELAVYDKAVRLIIKDKELDQGAEAMKEYISAYPNGVYVSNAQYWVGQVSFIQGDLNDAKKWFSELIQTNPTSQKAPEAKFKLGTVLHKLGEASAAKNMLTEVASSSSSAARLAQEYLKNNF